MRELQLDGIHDDGDHLVMTDSDGEQYTLRIDEALRAAVRRDRPALGMIQASEHTPLRPREIQAMLRAGRDAEEIARIADVGVEHVRRYEGPVIAEREYISERARTFHVGRGGGPALGEIAMERLRARRASDDARWDAWRNDDGTWTIELAFEAGGRAREAHWTVDMSRQSVTAVDDEARWLTDDDDAADEGPRGRVRLAAVRGRVYDVEADGGVQHPAPADTDTAPGAAPLRTSREEHPAAIDEDDLDALNARRGLRSVPSRTAASEPAPAEDDEPTGSVWASLSDDDDADDAAAAGGADADEEALREHATGDDAVIADPEEAPFEEPERLEDGQDAEVVEIDGDEDLAADGEDAADAPAGPAPAEGRVDTTELTPLPGFDTAETAEQAAPKPLRTKRRSAKRSSIPSWDEIVFGAKDHD